MMPINENILATSSASTHYILNEIGIRLYFQFEIWLVTLPIVIYIYIQMIISLFFTLDIIDIVKEYLQKFIIPNTQ